MCCASHEKLFSSSDNVAANTLRYVDINLWPLDLERSSYRASRRHTLHQFWASCKSGGVGKKLMEGVSLLFFPLPSLIPSPSPPLSYRFPFLPLRSRAPLSQLGVWGSAVSSPSRVQGGSSPGRKRIWCTLELTESHCMVAIILSMMWNEKLDLSWGGILTPHHPLLHTPLL